VEYYDIVLSDEFFDEIEELNIDHFKVSGHVGEFKINREMYYKIQEAGLFLGIEARDGDSIEGYISFVLTPNLHCGGLMALCDSIYLKECHRGSLLWKRLLTMAEGDIIDRGADQIVIPLAYQHRFGEVLKKVGYGPFETTFIKVI